MELMEPTFAFTITPMKPKQGIEERWSHHGRWLPPKTLGNNVSGDPLNFLFNPRNTNHNYTTVSRSLPQNAVAHKTYSLYLDRAIIWTVDYDAAMKRVGDGVESNPPEETPEQPDTRPNLMYLSGFENSSEESSDVEDSEDDDEDKDDWAPLKFDHRDRDLLSYAGRRQPHSRLRVRRPDQDWPQKLLPDTCSAQDETDNLNHGGLIGELPLLIGLMTFAIPEDQLARGLCQSMARPWQAPQFAREAGWKDKRGLIITTYACPPHSTVSDLIDYEQGKRGIILP